MRVRHIGATIATQPMLLGTLGPAPKESTHCEVTITINPMCVLRLQYVRTLNRW